MIWTKEEKVKLKIVKIGKKNKALGFAMLPVLFFVSLFFRLMSLVVGNVKKLSIVFCSLVMSTLYCSFSFPSFVYGNLNEMDSYPDVENESIEFAIEEEQMHPEPVELIAQMEPEEEAEHMNNSDELYFDDELWDMEIDFSKKDENTLSGTFTKDDWNLILVNKQNPIPDSYEIRLGEIITLKGSQQCDERIIGELMEMIRDAKEEGVKLGITSPYRDQEYQEMLFNRKINTYMGRGMSYLESYRLAGQAVIIPGSSEHQMGLALDIVSDTYRNLNEGFAETKAGKWLAQNCQNYGFILRYPKGKEYITGIEYEPWHFRYVGVAAATIIMEEGICLEEFWEDYL